MPRIRRPAHLTAALTLPMLAPVAGCCDLATLLCGPDKSEWVPVSYETDSAALATFKEALRRDDVQIIAECLSEDFKKRLEIDTFLAAVVWERLKKEYSGLHLLGTAETSGPERLPGDRTRYVLQKSGYRLEVVLRRFPFYGVHFTYAGRSDLREAYIEDLGFDRLVSVDQDDSDDLLSTVSLRIPHLDLPDGLQPGDIQKVVAGHVWKIDGLDPVQDGG